MTHFKYTLLQQCSYFIIALLCFCSNANILHAQSPVKDKPARILFLIDGSSSMTYNWTPNETRNKVASRIVNAICDSIFFVNKDVEFAIRTYGTQHPSQEKNCLDTRLEVPFTGYYNIQNLKTKVSQIRAYGYSPIAYSLQQAAEHDFAHNNDYAYSIILITDGGESCGGDICAIMQSLISKKISFKPYIISLVKDDLLAQQYECLGNYLNVANNNEIVSAIQKIIQDNKKVLSVKNIEKPAEIVKIDTPPTITTTPAFKNISQVNRISQKSKYLKLLSVYKPFPSRKLLATMPKIAYTYTLLEEDVVPAQFVTVQKIKSPLIPRKLNTKKQLIQPDKKRNIPKVKFAYTLLDEDIPSIQIVSVDKVKSPQKIKKYTKIYVIPSDYKKRKIPAVQYKYAILEDIPKQNNITTTNNTKPINTSPSRLPEPTEAPKDMAFTIQKEDADNTYLKVFIVNKLGKQYPAQPLMNIINTKTKITQKKYREVSNGQPKAIPIEAGNYNLSFGTSKDYAKSIIIEPNKTNIVTITINPSTISFYYETDSKRPVKEFRAYISNRFDPGVAVVTHPCDEKLYYDPANYHIEINTLPPTALNMDLEPNMSNKIALKETGTIQIQNGNKLGRIEFWFRSGTSDRFFYAMNITGDGNLSTQKQDFLPGIYEIRYYKPNAATMTIKKISIKSKETTAVTLD